MRWWGHMGRGIVVLVVCAAMASIPDAACAAGLSGSWSGTFAAGAGRSTGGTVTVSVAAAGKGVAGTVVLDTDGIRGAVRVKGRVRLFFAALCCAFLVSPGTGLRRALLRSAPGRLGESARDRRVYARRKKAALTR